MIIRFAEEKDIEQINKLLVQVNSIHHRGRPDLFKSGKKKYTDEELRKIMSDCDTPVLVAADDKDMRFVFFSNIGIVISSRI